MVALIAGPGGLRSVRDGGPLLLDLLLGSRVTDLVDHLLFLQRVGDLGGLAGKVEVPTDVLLGRWAAAKGVVVEDIVGLIELVA